MRFFQNNYSLPELVGFSNEEKKRIIKASQFVTLKNGNVLFSLVLMFLVPGISGIIMPKLIIVSSWYWKIESELVRRVLIEIVQWPLYIFVLVYFGYTYKQTFLSVLKSYTSKQ